MNEEFDIGWSRRAGRDLENISDFLIKNADPAVANKVVRGLFSAVEPTKTQPERYPPEPRLVRIGNFRFIRKWSFKIVYEFTGNQIIVHRIVHSRRDMKKALRGIR